MTNPAHLSIAIIGDEDLVNGMRLAGVSQYYVVEEDRDSRTDVRKAFTEMTENAEIGIIVIQEEHAEYVEDLIDGVRNEKHLTPVVVEVPSKYGTKLDDVRSFYKAYIKRFIGFDLEI